MNADAVARFLNLLVRDEVDVGTAALHSALEWLFLDCAPHADPVVAKATILAAVESWFEKVAAETLQRRQMEALPPVTRTQ